MNLFLFFSINPSAISSSNFPKQKPTNNGEYLHQKTPFLQKKITANLLSILETSKGAKVEYSNFETRSMFGDNDLRC